MWQQMRPFVEKERERTGREIGFMVDDLCRRLSSVNHATMTRQLGLSR